MNRFKVVAEEYVKPKRLKELGKTEIRLSTKDEVRKEMKKCLK
jgi:hypothetical protein